MRFKTQFLAVALSLTAAALPCFGQGVTYTTRSAFDAAVSTIAGTRTDVNFEGALPPGGIDLGAGIVRYEPPLTISGLTFRGSAPLLLRFTFANGRWLNNYDSLAPLIVDMNGPAIAFGADFASLISPGYSNFLATVIFDNGAVFSFTAPASPNSVFFGFVTTQPFSRVTFSDGGLIGTARLHEEILDNITAVTIPEPNVVALFALGAMLLGWRFLKRQNLNRVGVSR